MENKYTSVRLIDGKPRKVIVDKEGNITNKNPSREELRGLEKEPRKSYDTKKKYTRDELLNHLKLFSKENGRVPVERDFMNNPKHPSSWTYYDRFGSWNNALKIAELGTNEFLYTESELLNFLKQYYEKNGRAPSAHDFDNDPEYPSTMPYKKRFGNWNKALKLVELDVDSMIKKGILDTSQQKARLFERYVIKHFEHKPKDLSGENQNSPCDGICPKGKIYDVKSSNLRDNKHYRFNTRNKYREEIEYYYFGAFNSDWTKLGYVWRVPGEIVEKDYFIVRLNSGEFNIENMKEYEITNKFRDIDIFK